MNYKRLSFQDVCLSLKFLPLVASVRWRLWRTPFAKLHPQWRAQLQHEFEVASQKGLVPSDAEGSTPTRESVIEVWGYAHAIARAARLIPAASCLTQAMALQMVLARRGQVCSVHIGVDNRAAPNERRRVQGQKDIPQGATTVNSGTVARFSAHAWVEWQGRVLLGGNIRHWTPLTIFAPVVLPSDKSASAPSKRDRTSGASPSASAPARSA